MAHGCASCGAPTPESQHWCDRCSNPTLPGGGDQLSDILDELKVFLRRDPKDTHFCSFCKHYGPKPGMDNRRTGSMHGRCFKHHCFVYGYGRNALYTATECTYFEPNVAQEEATS